MNDMQKFYKLIVLFDLPAKTKENRRNLAKFRQFLIKGGYEMMQYSIYVRTCDGYNRVKTYKQQLIRAVPKEGSVRLLTITQNQFDNIEILAGQKSIIDISPEYEQLTIM